MGSIYIYLHDGVRGKFTSEETRPCVREVEYNAVIAPQAQTVVEAHCVHVNLMLDIAPESRQRAYINHRIHIFFAQFIYILKTLMINVDHASGQGACAPIYF